MKKEDLNSIEIEKLKQIISRTDKSGNEKVLLLMDFIYTRESAIHPDLEREKEDFAVGFHEWLHEEGYEWGNKPHRMYIGGKYFWTKDLIELYKNRDNGK